MPDLAEADVPVGSPTTVSRKLLQPVLLDTIRKLRTRSALGLAASSGAANAGVTPGPALQTPAPAAGMFSRAAKVEAQGNPGKGAGMFGDAAAEDGVSKQDALPEQDRYGVKRLSSLTLCACQSQAVAAALLATHNPKCGARHLERAISLLSQRCT